jgi:hypothetical protein
MGVDDIEKAAAIFTPPGWNPSKRMRFDMALVVAIGVLAMGLALHTAAACGYLTFMGYYGFAQAEEVTAQQMQLTGIQQDQKQQLIDRDQRQICTAKAAANQAAMNAWNTTLQNDIAAYWKIPQIKQAPQVLTCDQLMITGSGG